MKSAKRPVRMADIARAAGVSVMMVSRAYRDGGSVSEEKRAHILRIAEEMGYVFDATAANLRLNRTGFVAVTVPSINNANFADTVRALGDALAREGLQILLANTEYDPDAEARLLDQLLRRKPEALVVTGGDHGEQARKLLQRAGVPVVEIWDLPAAPIGHAVGFSNSDAMVDLVGHFARAGYRRLAFIGGETPFDSRGRDRRAGFIRGVAQHGLGPPRLVDAGEVPVSMSAGAGALAQLLAQYPDTDAVLCVSDLVAFGAMTEAQRRGLRIPQDLAFGGFGNFEIGRVSLPQITTVEVSAAQIGARAARLVLDLLADPARAPARIDMQPYVIARGSS
ncbi:transcriptional regulator, LacI family [Ketogulonicigenium vulgare]|uniref:Transcriptional regulator protein, LacI family protein n=2 Tax=Ketogulonicigenium vulgare TaxID=92945 RepID=F9Y8L9_KETVW|nr:transcriptional regulator protein, LacI family protein [Ketogulonicigenium vulgare WSH-001]ALJ81331.1 LacI family transcriptional regulator [Ketogulonicigenium vulgare]ANW34063.1 LacI family transcriptional regulator [Ketogulonicigenium vulgare]AOZ54917.1 transcriptional regulator, LacI family [Ketogulonicigenium vulgare]